LASGVLFDGGAALREQSHRRVEGRRHVTHLVATYAAGANQHQQKMFDDSLRAALNLDEIRAIVSELGFAEETLQATSDRHWTWIARKSES